MAESIYVGTESGIRVLNRAMDGSWAIGPLGLAGWSVEAIAVSPTAPETVFAGTRGDGVWRSTDAGQSWAKASYGRVGPAKVRSLTVDPHAPNRIWVGAEPIQVFVSSDESATWHTVESVQNLPWVTEVEYPAPTVEPHVRDIVIDAFDPETLYIALQVGYILKSVDSGATWVVLSDGLDCDVHQIVLDPRDSKRVLAATGGQDAQAGLSNGRALYSSSDGGTSWTPLAMNLEQDYALTLVMHPDNPSIMLSALAKGHPGHWHSRDSGAEGVLIRSIDDGRTWKAIDLSGAVDDASRYLAIAFCFDPAESDRTYAALSNGALLSSEDAGRTWTNMGVSCPGVKDIQCVRIR